MEEVEEFMNENMMNEDEIKENTDDIKEEITTDEASPFKKNIWILIIICVSCLLWSSCFSVTTIKIQNLLVKLLMASENLDEQEAQSKTTLYFGILDGTLSLFSFLFSPGLGVLSDSFGRKKILIISYIGLVIQLVAATIIVGLLMEVNFYFNYSILFVVYIIVGATTAEMIMYNSMISDVFPSDQRGRGFGLIGAFFGMGFLCGAISGVIVDLLGISYFVFFIILTVVCCLNLTMIAVFLKETLLTENRSKVIKYKRANPIGSLIFFFKDRQNKQLLRGLLPALFITTMGIAIYSTIINYFTQYQYGWEEKDVYTFLFFVGSSLAAVQASSVVVFKYITPEILLLISLIAKFISDTMFGFSTKTYQAYVILIPASISSYGSITISTKLASLVDVSELGELFGGVGCLNTIAMVTGKLLYSSLFSFFTSDAAPFIFAGAPFICSAILQLVILVLMLFIFKKYSSFTILKRNLPENVLVISENEEDGEVNEYKVENGEDIEEEEENTKNEYHIHEKEKEKEKEEEEKPIIINSSKDYENVELL